VRVAVVTTSYPSHSGQAAGHFVEAEVRERRARGESVTVIAPGPSSAGDLAAGVLRVRDGGLFGPPGALPRLQESPARARGIVSFTLGARRLLDRNGPFDVVIAHWLLPSAWPISLGKSPRLESVAHGSDVRLLARLPSALRLHIARQLMREGSLVRCVSEHVQSELLAATRAELRPWTFVAPSPFELPPTLERREARARLGLCLRPRLIVIVARLIPDKRVGTALSAVALLPDAQVVVVGGGPLLGQLTRDFPSVRFTGELARPIALDWIAAADVLVSGSRLEGAPTVVREARALGTSVVACAAGSLQALADGDMGVWLVPERRS
jgi:teichuronic acid biosynthesis glycosyltransferase TuaC